LEKFEIFPNHSVEINRADTFLNALHLFFVILSMNESQQLFNNSKQCNV